MVDDLGKSGRRTDKARFLLNILSSAAAPTNTLAGNPAVLKRAFETGGGSLRRGAGNWWRDVRHNGGMPATVDPGAFAVGRDLAVTAGAVVDRDECGEVIQYRPATPAVRRRPVLVVPPADRPLLLPGLEAWAQFRRVRRQPGTADIHAELAKPRPRAGWDLEVYARRVLSAIEVAREVTGSPPESPATTCYSR